LGKMEGVVKEGRTVLFVSHQISAINQLCRHIVWLDNGRVVDCGETPKILPKYLSMGLSEIPVVTYRKPKDFAGMFFSEISILNHEGTPSTELDARFPFSICLHYEVEKPLTGVEMAVRIRTADGISVFTSVYSDYSDASKMDKKPGSYVAGLDIPALFLMPDSYTVSVHAFQSKGDYEPLHILDSIIRFRI